jgi:FkbM family methyltransferase
VEAVNGGRGRAIGIFTGAYRLACKAKLLKLGWFQKSFLSAYFLYKRRYDDPFWNLARTNPELFDHGDVLDIGANVGYTSSVFAETVRTGSTVYAFEPDADSYALLRFVIARKNLSEIVETLNCAVGTSEGFLEFWHNEKHSADHRIVTPKFQEVRADTGRTSQVPVTSIDAFVTARNLQNISFIKIDVQGYEPAVCEGMKNTLQRFPEVCVCFEYSPQALAELGFAPRDLLEFFWRREYWLYILTRAGVELVTEAETLEHVAKKAGYVDILCSRKAVNSANSRPVSG